MLLERFNKNLIKECLLKKNDLVIVGLSGGPDSICLLDLFQRSKRPIIAAHFNHQLRDAADSDEDNVRILCRNRDIQLVVKNGDVARDAKINKHSIEEEARQARYRFLFDQARNHKAAAVAVGHNADDQVETVLMHILRGSGLSGLRGMRFRSEASEWRSSTPLIRPILNFWRSEIEAYCTDHKLTFIQDESNRDVTFFRNRLRNELLPLLVTYNPQIRERIYAMSISAQGDYELIDRIYHRNWKKCVLEQKNDQLALDRSKFLLLPLGSQRALVKNAVEHLVPGLRDITHGLIQEGVAFISEGTRSGKISWFNDLWIESEGEVITFRKTSAMKPILDYPQIEEPQELLGTKTIIRLNGKWHFYSDSVEKKPKNIKPDDGYEILLDIEKIHFPLVLRRWKPGDRIAPLGMAGKRVKVSDIWTRINIPKRARSKFPVLTDMDQVIWVPGFRQADSVRISPTTRGIIRASLRQDE